jgi:hypothetical protein
MVLNATNGLANHSMVLNVVNAAAYYSVVFNTKSQKSFIILGPD